jgi:hypothetical protein
MSIVLLFDQGYNNEEHASMKNEFQRQELIFSND